MLFTTSIFLFAFLPVCLAVYYGLLHSRNKRNRFLLIASLLFYAWGSVPHAIILMGSVIINWWFALKIERESNDSRRKISLSIAIVIDVCILFIFKYLAFAVSNINALFQVDIAVPEIALPLGISFFTFQAMSYVIDVHRGHGHALNNIGDVGLYISLFPQLIAGPIVRFEDFAPQIEHREESLNQVSEGVFRFGYGLAKKVLIANSVSVIAETAFQQADPSIIMAWLGAIAFTFQIYFDFSGYSDMAIGLGKMFGFEFKENFNYPYTSSSVSEFWRRWHISMGSWFRDYIYIPLGGSRVPRHRLFFNLFIVWAVTGLWHGANWTFIAWGMLQFLAISMEKLFKVDLSKGFLKRFFGHVYTLLFVVIGWVFFNSPSLSAGARYVSHMFYGNMQPDSLAIILLNENALVLALALLFSTPVFSVIRSRMSEHHQWAENTIVVVLYFLTIVFVVKGAYSPFIYFNF